MPFYEYRAKSGACSVCNGCFVDLQGMSEPAHLSCPDCGQECERMFAVPMVSVRGAAYRAASNKEKRNESYARAGAEVANLRESSTKKFGQVAGHTHNCALAGCYGIEVKTEAKTEAKIEAKNKPTVETSELSASAQANTDDASRAHRFGALPHLVGVGKK